jgi:hypothetical protein
VANALYDNGRQAFGEAAINWGADTIQAILVDTGLYTVNGARVGTALTLSSKSNVAGVMDAADLAFTSLVGAPSIEALVIYKSTGVESTSRLIAYIDTATGLPVAPGASQVNVLWDNGANKIFKL